jgi:putative zinc finger/helix-turn-helix YgiT family protein
MAKAAHGCTNCGGPVKPERRNYRYTESGLPNVVLQGVEVAECPSCGHYDVAIRHLARVHRAIALALAKSPVRLTGEQLRFLRKHVGYSGAQLAKYLHTDKTKISKWERGADPIGPSNDRLVRFLVAALDSDLRGSVTPIAAHLPEISDESGKSRELHIDVECLTASFVSVRTAA